MLYCKFLKLVNGENIIARTESDCSNIIGDSIEIIDPVEIRTIRSARGKHIFEHYTMNPWIRLSADKNFSILVKNIICIANADDEAVKQYDHFLNEEPPQYELNPEDLIFSESSEEEEMYDNEKPDSTIH